MSELIDQAGVDEASSGGGGPTPLADILGGSAADVTASSPGNVDAFGERSGEFDREPSERGGTVPHAALHAERLRRKRVDARVRELEEELQRFNDQRFGFDDDPAPSGAESSQDPAHSAWKKSYDKSLSDFTTKHGKDRVAAIDAVLPRLNPDQRNYVLALAGSSQKPVEDIEAYIEREGLLDPAFKALSLEDVLSGKKQPQPGDNQANARSATLDQREQALHAAERRTTFTASKSEFVSEYGKAKFLELDAASQSLMQSGHPAAAEYAQAIAASPDPVGAAAYLLSSWGLWSPAPPQQQPTQQPVFPSNVAAARNVGVRNGPMWAGPTPINDIFDRKTAQQ